ncbi:mortality factor 4-like protein 2 [Petaurus breviceps papuanus]|uniref:mortality factor 4-like protein 2 n=1 Tax=Petaurus breviceps papuanus TaxID=3040969 RepID=UPI0036DECD24
MITSEGDGRSPAGGRARALIHQPFSPREVASQGQLDSIVVIGGWEYEWVPQNRLLRYSAFEMTLDSDTALQMAAHRELLEDCPVSSSGDSTSEAAEPLPSKRVLRRERRGKGKFSSRKPKSRGGKGPGGDFQPEVQVYLSKVLKPMLVQDWEMLTFSRRLFTLPARKSVDSILTEYASLQENSSTAAKKHAVHEVMAMIKEYFDLVLGTQLLYNYERSQYAEILISYPTAQMSQVYGGAHQLRLFPQMGSMLACTSLGQRSINVLLSHLHDFLEYLANDPSLLGIDPTDYHVPPAEYQWKAE